MGGFVCLLKMEYAWVMVCAAPLLLCLFLKPGSPVYSTKCQNCVCTNSTDNVTQVNYISCTHVPCDTSCSPVSVVPPFLPFSCLSLPSSHLQRGTWFHVHFHDLPSIKKKHLPCRTVPPTMTLLPCACKPPPRWGVSAIPESGWLQGQVFDLSLVLSCVHRALSLWKSLGSAAKNASRLTASLRGQASSISS